MNGAAVYASVQQGNTKELVLQHTPLVKRIAYHLQGRLPDTVLLDDLIQAGMVGLLEAIKNYNVDQGASFETYAGIRIRGAMLDEVRRADWTPRSVHRKSRMVAEAIREVENKLGRDARDVDVAEFLGISISEYNQILQDSIGCKTFSVEELDQAGDTFLKEAEADHEQPVDQLLLSDFHQALADAIKELPEREQLVISLYYDDELNLKEIGQVLEVSESRVSQISSQAVLRLRARLSEWLKESEKSV